MQITANYTQFVNFAKAKPKAELRHPQHHASMPMANAGPKDGGGDDESGSGGTRIGGG